MAQFEGKNEVNTEDSFNKNEILRKSFRNYEIISLPATNYYQNLKSDKIHEFKLSLGNNAGKVSLKMWHDYAIQGDGVVRTSSNNKSIFSKPITLKGYNVATSKNTRLTLNKDFIYGFVNTDKGTFYVEPLHYFVKGASKDQYVIYNAKDVIFSKENTCGAIESGEHMDVPLTAQKMDGECLEIELAVASDYSMFQKYETIEGVNNHNTGVMNNVQGNYDDEFADELQFVFVEQYVIDCAGCDPWTSSTDAGTVLSSFTNWAPNGFSETHDLGQFWTNRDFAGSTIGIAWVGVVCTSNRYHALSDFSNNANLKRVMVSHEIGHNFSAGHDAAGSPYIMAPSVQNTAEWSANSINVIQNHYNSRNCLAVCAPPAPPEAEFEASHTSLCTGSSVQFFDKSLNNPTSWSWVFEGGTPSVSSERHPVVSYENEGSYQVSLTVTSANGSDLEVQVGYIDVTSSGGEEMLILENFDNGLGSFNLLNPDGNITWDVTSVPGSSGSNNVAFVDNFDYNAGGQFDALASNVIDLSTRSSARLRLEYAFARYNSTNLDKFRIKVSTDGGNTFPNTVFEGIENGSGNFATSTDQVEEFIPVNSTDWCVATNYGPSCIDLNLNSFVGESQVVILLENECGFGNNLYIDNVWLSASCEILEPPVAAFTSNGQEGCSPFIVQFTDQSSNNPSSWSWTFEGGLPNTSTEQNPVILYENEGEFDVTLTVTNESGSNTITFEDYIQVQSAPIANFTYSVNGNTVLFTNTSSGTIDSYSWNFGDNSSSIEENPVHTYLEDGTYEVFLTVSNECGSSTFSINIEIDTEVQANFTSDVTSGCAPLTVAFSDDSQNATAWAWTFEGGNPSTSTDQNPTIIYHDAGTYNVQLIASNGTDTDTLVLESMITVNDVPVADFDVELNGLEATFTDNSSNATDYSWNFGDGNSSDLANPVHQYEQGGAYIVTLSVSNDCGTAELQDTLTITDLPTANFNTSTTSGCIPFNIMFTNESSSNTDEYSWVFEGGTPATSDEENPTVVYNEAGTFDVTLIVSNSSGNDTLVRNDYIIVGLDPIAEFTSSANGNEVSFTNQSMNADSYSWDFGDGNSSDEEDPVHTYEMDGAYTVTLVASNGCGSSTKEIVVTVVTDVTADASADVTEGCTPLSVIFENLSSDNATTFEWLFEGGTPSTSTLENPTVVYNEAGLFDVRLIASNGTFKDTVQLNNYIVVGEAPQAEMTFSINELEVSFMSQSDNAESFSWNFGDGTTSDEENPTHTYSELGQYLVTLIVTNDCGTDTISNNINVSSIPTANFSSSSTEICEGETIEFTNTSSSNATSVLWEFEGGTPGTSTEENPTVTYTTAGVYNVKLTATNGSGSDVLLKEEYITVNPKPIADFTYVVNGGTVQLTNTSQNAASYLWSNNVNQDISMDENPTMTFAQNGQFEITLEVTNSCGTDSKTIIVSITGYPNVSFSSSISEGCNPLVVTFKDESTDGVINRKWEFPGGTPESSTEKEVEVTYNDPGTFNVILFAENEVGTSTITFDKYVNVYETPTASIAYNIVENTVEFKGLFEDDLDVLWDFGDGNESTDKNPIHTYAETGTYTVVLKVSNEHCSYEVSKDVQIKLIDTKNVDLDRIQLFPNPNTGSFVLKIQGSKSQTYQIELLNKLGQSVYLGSKTFTSSSTIESFDFDLTSGLYFMKVYNESSSHLIKVVINR